MKGSLPENNFVLLETNRFDKDNSRSYLFTNPTRIISCYNPEKLKEKLSRLDGWLSKGYYAAGFISYEAGYIFEEGLKKYMDLNPLYPLMWFGIYKDPIIFDHKDKIDVFTRGDSLYSVNNLRANVSQKEYIHNINRIKNFIRQGNTYQVNYTFKYKFDFSGSLYSFYQDLKEKQSVSYSALIKTQDHSILSLSPELFFKKNRKKIEVRPMKGTFNRGRDLAHDRLNMSALRDSLKDRSENVMIVDLLRNDLGRICKPGTVKATNLFEVERYETLLQMISIVTGSLKKDIGVYDLLKAIFPSGSVTGAPKINTMGLINSLEEENRNVYTGGVGFFAPGGKAVFNVAIRTVLIDQRTKEGEMGIGSGIVYDSNSYKEFEECKLKANFITQQTKHFKLIETLLYKPGKGYFLLRYHMDRLLESAEYFNFRCDKRYVARELNKLKRCFKGKSSYRVRLLLDKGGKVELEYTPIASSYKDEALPKVKFSSQKSFSSDIFLYHKTTERKLYDDEYKKWRKRGYFDIIFTNEKKQVTEGAISNIVIKKDRTYYTPPLDAGLLNGVCRRALFKKKKISLKEKMLYKKDICEADELYMINSVRGMVRVRI